MIKYMAIIPARKNSKRIPNKNITKLKNKMLFDYTLEATKKSKLLSKVVITTDIKKLIKKENHKFIYIRRPKKLSLSHCSTESAVFHALRYLKRNKKIEPKNIVILQPTSPFRNNTDIDKSIKFFERGKFDSLFSAYNDKLSVWKNHRNKFSPITYKLKNRKREQDSKPLIIENGAIYIFNYKKFFEKKVRLFGKIGCYLMGQKNSIEIDDPYDLMLARKVYE